MTVTLPFVLLVLAFVAFLLASIPPAASRIGLPLLPIGLALWVASILFGVVR